RNRSICRSYVTPIRCRPTSGGQETDMKFSRHIAGALIATLMVACGSVATTTTTSTTVPPTTSTTVPATTTTTVPPFEVDGASAELTDLVESFYEYSASRTTEVPPLPFPVASLTPVE